MGNKTRCAWCEKDDLYRNYHDNEWGNPVYEDDKLFEFLVLETFQAGLSWYTILKKRDNFRKAFDQFNYKKIAQYGDAEIERLMQDAGIIRNGLKIKGTITNAIAFMETQWAQQLFTLICKQQEWLMIMWKNVGEGSSFQSQNQFAEIYCELRLNTATNFLILS